MRTTALSALVVLGATLAASSPIRVVVTTHQEVSSNLRYGNALPALPVDPLGDVATVRDHFGVIVSAPTVPLDASFAKGNATHFCKSIREKMLDASNRFRAVFGLAPIAPDAPRLVHGSVLAPLPISDPDLIRIMPFKPHGVQDAKSSSAPVPQDAKVGAPVMPFVGTPVRPAFVEGEEAWGGRRARLHRIHRHGSFLRRVHHALMALGPWEGRAVAFVLGCGIGVLLRMMWVMVLVAARAIRGPSRGEESDEDGYDVVFDDEAELLVPPPQYTVVAGNEAVPVPADEKAEKA